MRYIVANSKQNMVFDATLLWLAEFGRLSAGRSFGCKVVLAPSFLFLPVVSSYAQKLNIAVAAQSVSSYDDGAHTGQIGAKQIRKFCEFAIVGHSDLSESVDAVLRQRDLCLKVGITPLVCFVSQKDAVKYAASGAALVWEDPRNISEAGTYVSKDPGEVREGLLEIKESLDPKVPVLYGGSVNRGNAYDLALIDCLDGVLVGNAGLDPKHFSDIIGKFEKNV